MLKLNNLKMRFLTVPFKKPCDVDFSKPLKNFLRSFLNKSCDDELSRYMEVSDLRSQAISKFGENDESSLEYIYRYYDQLCCIENKIPIDELQIPFKWNDAFDRGSIFSGKISLTQNSLKYEKLCILFNIGASQNLLAASKSRESDDDIKLTIKYFQQAAGIFQLLKNSVSNIIATEPTPDLKHETLTTLTNLMIAQAQELFILKAIRDKLKDYIVAKLCNECQQIYLELLNGMSKGPCKSIWDKNWISTVSAKQSGYYALMQLYQSKFCRTNKNIGEEICRLRNATEYFKLSQSMSNINFFYDFENLAIQHLTESTKDNDFIYNEIIPDIKTLDMPGKVLLAKPLQIVSPLSTDFHDLFIDLTPVVVHQAISASDCRKNEAINAEIIKLRDATNSLNGMLSSLNLPAAVEIDLKGTGLPPSIQIKSEDIKSKGGIQSIAKLIKELPELLIRNREILDECERLLVEEQNSDDLLRSRFKERWTRVPSEKLTGMFHSNAQKYRDIINNAIEADRIVRQKFEKNKKGMEILSSSTDAIVEALPSSCEIRTSRNPSMQNLRDLMESVNNIKEFRDVIESDLKLKTIDLKEIFMDAFKNKGFIDEPAISVPEINKSLLTLHAQTEESLQKQNILIEEIQKNYNEFVAVSGFDNATRDSMLAELAASYDSFIDLNNNLKEGIKFYNDLTQLLVVFQNKVADYCFARKTEKDELLKDLTQQASRQNSGSIQTGEMATTSNTAGSLPYPTEISGMPFPCGVNNTVLFPTYAAPPMPQGFNPYGTLPYPSTFQFNGYPRGPQSNNDYGTWSDSFSSQQAGNIQQQKPPGW